MATIKWWVNLLQAINNMLTKGDNCKKLNRYKDSNRREFIKRKKRKEFRGKSNNNRKGYSDNGKNSKSRRKEKKLKRKWC